jgi:hypothetical protein
MNKKPVFAIETDLKILLENSPRTPELDELVDQVDYVRYVNGEKSTMRSHYVNSATDPWHDMHYQSLYIDVTGNPADRVVLQEPTSKEPMVGVLVLKAARLSGRSGMVYCGTPPALKSFAAKLPIYEERGVDLEEKEFLECLMDAAKADGLRIIYHRDQEEEEYGSN